MPLFNEFELLGQTSMWAMRPLVNLNPRARGAYMLQVVGRMKPGVSIEQVRAELLAIVGRIAADHPQYLKTGRPQLRQYVVKYLIH